MENRTWKNIELNNEDSIKLKSKLLEMKKKNKNLKYETSGAYNLVHFEIYVTDTELNELNLFLDSF